MAMYGGIDLHANNCWVSVLDGELRTQASTRVPNEIDRVIEVLEPFRRELAGVVVESTWNWYWLVDGLMDDGFCVHLANPSALKQYEGLKYTDDRNDARFLAKALALGILPTGYIYPKEYRGQRDLARRRASLVKSRSAMLLTMKGALECRTGRGIKSDDLKRMSVDEILRMVDDEDVARGISCFLEPTRALDVEILKIERHLLKVTRPRPELELLRSIPGVGVVLALTILYEVGDFASYARLVKSTWTTNSKKKGRGNVRNGNPHLSWAFTEAAHFAVRYCPEAKRFADRKRAKRNGIVANRALAHKLARATYHMLRKGERFDAGRAFA